MRRIVLVALVPPLRGGDPIHGHRRLQDSKRQVARELGSDAFGHREHQVGMDHHPRRHQEMRDGQYDASLVTELRERVVDQAMSVSAR